MDAYDHDWDTQGPSDQQPMQATKQWQARQHLQPTLTQYTHSDTDYNLFEKSFRRVCIRTPSHTFHMTESCQMYAFDE